MRRQIPRALLPIAADSDDSKLCIGVRGFRRGRIYYWDRCGDRLPRWWRWPYYHKIWHVAADFDALMFDWFDLSTEDPFDPPRWIRRLYDRAPPDIRADFWKMQQSRRERRYFNISEFEYPGPLLDDEKIARFAQEQGIEDMPDEYRALLLRSNGGRPVLERSFEFETMHHRRGILDIFYSVSHRDETRTVAYQRRALKGQIPDHFVPIARDTEGTQICLVPPNYRVYYWTPRDGVLPDYRHIGDFLKSLVIHYPTD